MRQMAVHLLHIGKTGGTALKSALQGVARPGGIISSLGQVHIHGHDMTLDRLPAGDVAVCFLRDPVARFVSGFDSRRRRGRPRYHSRWSAAERLAFTRFASASALAEGLADSRPTAERAMRSIQHVNSHYTDWLGPVDSPAIRRERLAFVGRQETLAADVARLQLFLGLDQPLVLPTDSVAAHRNPITHHEPLTERAVTALTTWYRDDYALLAELTGSTDLRGL